MSAKFAKNRQRLRFSFPKAYRLFLTVVPCFFWVLLANGTMGSNRIKTLSYWQAILLSVKYWFTKALLRGMGIF